MIIQPKNGGLFIVKNAVNLFDPAWILAASGWEYDGEWYFGKSSPLFELYNVGRKGFPIAPMPTRISVSFTARVDVSGGNNRFGIRTTDVQDIDTRINYTDVRDYYIETPVGKTTQYLYFTYGSGGERTVFFKNVVVKAI